MAVRAVRGATQVDVDDKEHVLRRTRELLQEVLSANKIEHDDVISIVFSATRDVSSVAPAVAARQLGLEEPALFCLQEMYVEGSMPRVVRLMLHVETELARADVQNVYLRGTELLRADVPTFED
ncbi:chorismate mutase [Spongisporangium articulatum]|uniref:chorismate mutase n=1 Tax=Spongisporangium articulatum TaxID=3362603 RepID=A0ABW8ATY2_9ACTN